MCRSRSSHGTLPFVLQPRIDFSALAKVLEDLEGLLVDSPEGSYREVFRGHGPEGLSNAAGGLKFPVVAEHGAPIFVRYEAALIEEHGAVEGVALDGLEAGVADDAAEFFFRGAVAGAGGFDDVLFEHDGAYVVAAEAQAQLEDLEALRDPAGLHVLDVVEVEARDGEDLAGIRRRSLLPIHEPPRAVLLALEGPGDEGGESAGLFLQLRTTSKWFMRCSKVSPTAEHHGGGGAHAELMRGAMDVDPVLRCGT